MVRATLDPTPLTPLFLPALRQTFGCGSAIASSSLATEWVQGKSIDECLEITNKDIASHLKLPPVKLHCSMLAEDAIHAAVKDYKSKKATAAEA
jgi:nitrogen fixation NifU-like protein